MNTPTEVAFNKQIHSLAPCKTGKPSSNQEYSLSRGSYIYTEEEERAFCAWEQMSQGTLASLQTCTHMYVKEKKSIKKNGTPNKLIINK